MNIRIASCAVLVALIMMGAVLFPSLAPGHGESSRRNFNSTPVVFDGAAYAGIENMPPVALIGDRVSGYMGYYYNLPADHPDVEGEITGIQTGDSPFNHDWYDAQYFSFRRLDPSLAFGNDFFPVDQGLPGDPHYFAVHWHANITVPAHGDYAFTMGSDDDSWLYINDVLVMDLGGIHALVLETGTVYLEPGTHSIDIYFAERHITQSGFHFEFLDPAVEVASAVPWDEMHADVGEDVFLKGSCSYDRDGFIQAFEWDFGDGSVGFGPETNHAYSRPGTYTVALTVTDDMGLQDTDLCLIHVSGEYVDLYLSGHDIAAKQPLTVDRPTSAKATVHCRDPYAGENTVGTEWNGMASLPQPSAGYAQTYEGEIYFIGENSVQKYDPSTDVWTVINNQGVGYQPYRGGSAIIGDRIYIVKGWSKASYYNISSNEFVNIPDPAVCRLDVAVAQAGGKIYVSGGWKDGDINSLKTVEEYDPATNRWTTVEQMNVGRKDHEMIGVGDYIYAMSGLTGNSWIQTTTAMERYDPAADTWTLLEGTANGYREFGLATDGRTIMLVSTACEFYDIAGNTWVPGPSITGLSDIGFGYYANAAVYNDGHVYTIGGRTAPDNWYGDVMRTELGSTGTGVECTVSVYIDRISEEDLIFTRGGVWVPSNGETTVDFAWTPRDIGTYELIVIVSDANPSEIDLTNNTASAILEVRDAMPSPWPADIEYWIEYINYGDETTVNEDGICFYSSGAHPDRMKLIPFNETFRIPEEDYGVYPLYNCMFPLMFRLHIRNMGESALTGIRITAIQERHNTVTIWDSMGMVQLVRGEMLEGTAPLEWIADMGPEQEIVLSGSHMLDVRGWGLNQTHLIIEHNGTVLVDDPFAGVYCPP